MRTTSRWTLAAAAVAATIATGARDARADDADAGTPHPFHPHVVGDVRAAFLWRHDNNYFQHTSTFGYSMPGVAGGAEVTAGAELLPRVSLVAEGLYVGDGADRADARLRLRSGAVLGVLRVAVFRSESDDGSMVGEIALDGGAGWYSLSESFVDVSLSPQVFSHDVSGYGGMGGIEGSFAVSGFRSVIAYGYHYAPESVGDRINGSVFAGGHELSIGIGVRL